MSEPLVTVVMPVYNAAAYLDEAIGSILGQTLADFEFIIVDDGSTDASAGIMDSCARRDSRITILHQSNSGLAVALNRGLEIARGDYIARMDADDISLPDRLENQARFMDDHPEVGVCGTACRQFGERTGLSWTMTASEEIKSRLLFWPCMVHPTAVMRRGLMVERSLFYNPEFRQAEDYELWVRFSRCCEMANLPEPLLLYRTTAKQATSAFEDDIAEWSGRVQRELLKDFGLEPSVDEMMLHRTLHKSRFECSRDYVTQVEDWLCKLLAANERARLRDPGVFAEVLFERWQAVCSRQIGLGYWAWRRFRSSPLYVPARSSISPVWFMLRGCPRW